MASNFRQLTKALVLTCAVSSIVIAQEPSSDKPPTASDNTKLNQQDRNSDRVTADQQKENVSDLSITREIRKELTDDKSLSAYAHNVKIITQNGTVTLKGPVRTEEEKSLVEAKAASVSGKAVNSELSVAPKKK
jgi:hyperosmotically inducible periplasmic protein